MISNDKGKLFNGWFVFFSLAAVVFICYSPALKNGFTNWDDQEYVLHNKAIQTLSTGSIAYLFSHFLIISYNPLTLFSLQVNYFFSGTSPFGYIFTNIIFHLLNCFLLFVFLKDLGILKQAAYLIALLFAVHPLHVESVAWIAERKDVLFAFFFLLALIYYVRYFKTKDNKAYFLAILFFLCSCMSKAEAITLSLLLFPIDYFITGNFQLKNIRKKIPFIFISVFFGILSVKAQGANVSAFTGSNFTFLQRLAFAAHNYILYIAQILFPLRQSVFYPYPASFSNIYFLFIPAALVIFFLPIFYLRKNKQVIFAILFFTLNIFFLLQILPVGDAIMADRYTYLSSIGVFIPLVYAGERMSGKSKGIKYIVQIITVIYFLFLAQATFARCGVWRNGITLWNDVIKNYPETSIAYVNRGANYYDKGDTSSAFVDFKKALDLDPSNSFARYNTATIYYNRSDFENSLNTLKGIDTGNSANTDAFLLKAYSENKLGDYSTSLRDVEIYLGKKKTPEALTLAGLNSIMMGDYTNAKKDLDAAIEKNQSFADAYVKRGVILIQSGDTTNACNDWQKAVLLGNNEVEPFLKMYCK